MAKYDRIGITYNKTRKADPYLVSRMKDLLSPQTGEQFLDIGCGTGNYCLPLAEYDINIIGIDPSEEMLGKARSRSTTIKWKQGNAEEIPLPSTSQDGVMAWLTTHHWTDIDQGFREVARVLKPGGRLLIFTSTPEQMADYWLHHYFPEMMKKSGLKMNSELALSNSLQKAGLSIVVSEPYHVREDLQDLFLQSGKYNPEMYFRPEIRQGISSFADVSKEVEVKAGLTRLRQDIDSGVFHEVAKRYSDERGDYLFLLASKEE